MTESRQSGRNGEFFVLAAALRAFKTGPLADVPSDRALAKAAGVSPSTVGDWLRGKRFPQDIGKILIAVRMVRSAAAARGIASPGDGPVGLLDDDRWRAAHQQEARRRAGVVSDEVQRAQAVVMVAGPAARVRVGEADPRRLGVHAAISAPAVPDEIPPEYVPRDADTAQFGVRARVAAAAERGGFVLLVGGSSVGKTRCAAEAVRALLPDWWLVHPAGSAEVAALAQVPMPRTVVWLDELQRYLDGEHGLTGGMVRTLLGPPHHAVIIGTLWPDRYTAYTAVPAPGGQDPHARERQVLDLAAVIRTAPSFSPAEQERARAAAGRDMRLKIALESAGYGLTQTLAAAPQLVARWEDAQTASPYAWAVLTAALDAARLGARAPLDADFLRSAAVDYCTSQQQAEAPHNWFEQALAYATEKLHGAVAALSPAGSGMGKITGYTVADYLTQHASRERYYARVPASTWDALTSHTHDPADATRLADSARNRLLYCYAIPLYRGAADAGDRHAARRLTWLLEERGDLDGLTQVLHARAEAGDMDALVWLVRLLARRGDLDGLRALADTGDEDAAFAWAKLLARRGDLDGLRDLADAGNKRAARQLTWLLEERGDLDGLTQVLRARADAGDMDALVWLVRLLARRGDLDGLRALADAGNKRAARQLTWLLDERGDLAGATQYCAPGPTPATGTPPPSWPGSWPSAATWTGCAPWPTPAIWTPPPDCLGSWPSAATWPGPRRYCAPGPRPATGTPPPSCPGSWPSAATWTGCAPGPTPAIWTPLSSCPGSLAERGDLDGLRARADAGDMNAAFQLARLLEERGDLDGATRVLRALADAGVLDAASWLADLLRERGDLDGLTQVLRARADAGDRDAAAQLPKLLAERGDLDGLRARADAGDMNAAFQLASVLAERGDLDGATQVLRALADAGDRDAASWLARLLAERGDLDGLRARADAGDMNAALWLVRLLAPRSDPDGLRERGDLDGLRARADAGDMNAAWRLSDLLAERGDLDGLRARADAGDWAAAAQLPKLLAREGRDEEAERLRRFGLNPDGSIARV